MKVAHLFARCAVLNGERHQRVLALGAESVMMAHGSVAIIGERR